MKGVASGEVDALSTYISKPLFKIKSLLCAPAGCKDQQIMHPAIQRGSQWGREYHT